jgi:DNA uptake protein ComE-like DNA-binding protein
MSAALSGAEAAEDPPPTPYNFENQLDLNRATLEEIRLLPVPEDVAKAIWDHRTYVSFFTNVYDLLQVEGVTPELLVLLKPMVRITPDFEIRREELLERERRAQERYYVLQRMLSDEGSNEGLVDSYVDELRDPGDINNMTFHELISFQNVSPIDALAVIKERDQAGRIENQRQLRSADGISYWGYRNLRDFVRFDNPRQRMRITGDYQLRIYNTPYLLDQRDIMNEPIAGDSRVFDLNTHAGRLKLDTHAPYLTNKLRLRLGRYWNAGLITHRNLGEEKWNETSKFHLELRDLPPTETALGTLRLHSAVAGHYAVTFGQGVVMDATDFFSSRRTGYGFNPRIIGLRGDLSRSDEFTMRGLAVDASLGRLRGTFFYSRDDKDAILNPDGSFNSYIVMIPRLSNSFLAGIQEDLESGALDGKDPSAFLPMRDVMDEQVYGGNLKYEFIPGTYLGLTGAEMRYKNNVFDTEVANRWDPDPTTLVIDPNRLEDRDAEIGARYNSIELGNYRRVYGAEAQSVYKNVSVAAEYGKLETSNASSAIDRIFDAGPEAFVANAYLQYENFNFLALYRDYDIGYDNPYSRSFSEDSKFEQTLLDGNPFRLNNPYFGQLGLIGGTPVPKGERGWFFSTRFQPARQFIITGLEFDTWTRLADGADQRRLTFRGEYRPVFPVRFRIRHRVSSRDLNEPDDIRRFDSWDTRVEMRVNLSNFDRFDILFSTTSVRFSSRGRLNGPAGGGDTQADSTASAGLPGRALQARLQHNFGSFLSMIFSTQIYDGFLWNYEDNEFVVVDGEGFRNWIMVRSRLSENLSWRFKWTTDFQRPRTYIDIRSFGSLVPPTPDASNARQTLSSYRFQLDFSF